MSSESESERGNFLRICIEIRLKKQSSRGRTRKGSEADTGCGGGVREYSEFIRTGDTESSQFYDSDPSLPFDHNAIRMFIQKFNQNLCAEWKNHVNL